jgi:CRISPR/Cas system-associated endonuclease Cas1
VVLKSGNSVSTGALASLGFWGIDVLIMTQKGQPVAMLKSLDDDSHVKTRICQYEALNNGKGISVAKKIMLSRIESQNLVLKKHGLRQHDLLGVKKAIDGVPALLEPSLWRLKVIAQNTISNKSFSYSPNS